MTTTVLDWRNPRHWNNGNKAPCIHCGKPAFLLDDNGQPAHKTCAEQQHFPQLRNPATHSNVRVLEGRGTGRLMSVSLTQQAVRDRSKTVTRRLGWRFLRPGHRLTLCQKVQGRHRGEPLVRLAAVEIVDVRREQLWHIDQADITREGFPSWSCDDFVAFFCKHMRCQPWTEITRIEWRYLP